MVYWRGAGIGGVVAMDDDRVRVAVVEASWREVIAWCQQHAPVTAAALQGPVDEAALLVAQQATGREWPPELVAWFRTSDGAGRSQAAALLPPLFVPLGVEDAVAEWRMLTKITDELHGQSEQERAQAESAGSKSFAGFLRSWLPIVSDFCGDHLFVDLRPGSRHGCVGEYVDGEGFLREPLWDDLAAMIKAVADGLRFGRWIRGDDVENDKVPVVEDGRLRWDDGTDWELCRAVERPIPEPEDLKSHFLVLAWSGHTDGEIAVELGVPRATVIELWERFVDPELAEKIRARRRLR